MDEVVVAEYIAVLYLAVGVVEVVLQNVGIVRIVTFAELVDVEPEFSAEQVAYCLVVMCACHIGGDTCLEVHVAVQTVVEH